MQIKLPVLIASLFIPLCTAFAIPVNSINQLIVFGDSLSDSGNASIATTGSQPGSGGYYYRSTTGLPFQIGEFTNAPTATGPTGVWVDQFAPKLGLPVAQPFSAPTGGTNFAIASAQTGSNGLSGVTDQLGYFNAAVHSIAPSSALYTFWAGANDIAQLGNPITAADNLYSNIQTISAEGGKYFLWFNLPDLGKTPDGIASGFPELATAASQAFDLEWQLDLAKLQAQGVDVVGVDVYSEFQLILSDPAAFGFTNVTDPAISSPGANPDQYLFFDGAHPTAAADALVADLAFSDLTAASTPEPSAVCLAFLGLAGFGALRIKVRKTVLS